MSNSIESAEPTEGAPAVEQTDSAEAAVDSDFVEESDAEAEPDLPLNVVFEILKNRRRRLVLKYLQEAEGSISIGDLSEHIAAIENEIDVQQLNSQQRKRVYIGLYQCHLPKMDDAGVIEFNQSRGNVELSHEAESLYEYLEPTDKGEAVDNPEPSRPHAVLAVLFGVTFAVAEVTQVHMISSVLVFGFFLLTLYLAARDDLFPLPV